MKRKLNLGCGDHILFGFVNIDNIPHCKDVYLDDIVYLKTFEDNSIDFIYTSHVLQCIFPRSKVPEALKTWYRVLKLGGRIILEVPNIVPLTKKYLNGERMNEVSIEIFIRGIYGHDTEGLRQFMCFDFEYLKKLLEEVGFKNIHQIEQPTYSRHDPNTNLVVEAWK